MIISMSTIRFYSIRPQLALSICLLERLKVLDGLGNLITPPKWNSNERLKFQGLHRSSYDTFGTNLALDGSSLMVGTPGYDQSRGVAYAYDVLFYSVGFVEKEKGVLENRLSRQIEITVSRTGSTTRALTIRYATSDNTAVGIDATQYAACLLLPLQDRTSNCGDYQQTAGELVFGVGESLKQIVVPIMDDECYEHDREYFQIDLHIPGGDVLPSEYYGRSDHHLIEPLLLLLLFTVHALFEDASNILALRHRICVPKEENHQSLRL